MSDFAKILVKPLLIGVVSCPTQHGLGYLMISCIKDNYTLRLESVSDFPIKVERQSSGGSSRKHKLEDWEFRKHKLTIFLIASKFQVWLLFLCSLCGFLIQTATVEKNLLEKA